MNKVVTQHIPVAELPVKVRGSLPASAVVTVVLEVEALPEIPDILEEIRRFRASTNNEGVSTDDAVARIRALRDEWDD